MAVKDTAPTKASEGNGPARRGSFVLGVPPLETGDRLTRPEFERRYEAMPHVKKAELVEGVVYIQSAVRCHGHAVPHANMIGWLGLYVAATPGVEAADNATVRLDMDNEVQPDALLRLASGGKSRLSEDDYIEGAPELIVEIAGSSAAYDLHDKLRVYWRNGVQEYIVWQVYEEKIDWFELREGEYAPLPPDENGRLNSRAFPGLCLDAPALLQGDLAAVLAAGQETLGTADHAGFVEQLKAR